MCLAFVCLAACAAAAQTIDAERLIAADPAMDRDTLFRLQLLARRPAEALQTLRALPPSAANVRWEIYAKAKSSDKPFDEAFRQAFRDTMQTIDDKTAHRVLYTFGTSLAVLQRALDDARAKNTDAIDLARKTLSVEAYRSFSPLLPELMDEDDRRRYAIEKDVRVRMPDGGTVCALIIRPRSDRRLPTLFNFTIYADGDLNYAEARRNASNGYAAILGLIRGKGCSPDTPVPYEHDSTGTSSIPIPSTPPTPGCSTTRRTTTARAGRGSIASTTRAAARIATSRRSTAHRTRSSTAGSRIRRTTPTGEA